MLEFRRAPDHQLEFPGLRRDHDVDRLIRQDRLFRSDRIADGFFGLLLAAYFAPLAALAVHDLPSRRLIHAAEELTLLRTIAGAMGITLLGVVVTGANFRAEGESESGKCDSSYE